MKMTKVVELWNTHYRTTYGFLRKNLKEYKLGAQAFVVVNEFDVEPFKIYDVHPNALPKEVQNFFKVLPTLYDQIYEIFRGNSPSTEGETLLLLNMLCMAGKLISQLRYVPERLMYTNNTSLDKYDPNKDGEEWLITHLNYCGFTDKRLSGVVLNTTKFLRKQERAVDFNFTDDDIRRMRLTIIKAFKD